MDEMVNRHHAHQKLLARNVIAELQPLWGILRFRELQDTTADWLRAVRPVIERGFLASQFVAAEFAKAYRSVVFATAEPLSITIPNPFTYATFGNPQIPDRHTQLKIMVAMKVTGPIHVAKQMPMEENEAMARGFSKSSGAATRLVLNGGRGMIRQLADVDPLAIGVAAVVDEDACSICQPLRKPTLKSQGAQAMDRIAVGHDFCRCSARLVYPENP